MRGTAPTIADINLDLNNLVLPSNLLSNEVLQPEEEQLEEELSPFRIDTCCFCCNSRVRITVFAVAFGIRFLEHLLLDEKLAICCPGCARRAGNHGRS